MAQRAIGEYYTVRKRSCNHGSIKRRKLSEDTRFDIPVVTEGDDTSSIPLTQPEMVSSQQNETKSSATRAARGRPRRKVGGSSASSRKGRSVDARSKGKGKESEQQSLKTLLSFISKAKDEDLSTVEKPATLKGISEEDPLPPTNSLVVLPPSAFTASPRKRESSFEPATPTKVRLVEDQTSISTRTNSSAPPSPFKTPQASPWKDKSSAASSPARRTPVVPRSPVSRTPVSPFRTTKLTALRPSPLKSPPKVETRGEALVRLAREKVTKSPAKSAPPSSSPQTRTPDVPELEMGQGTGVRRRLLTDPEPVSPGALPSARFKLTVQDTGGSSLLAAAQGSTQSALGGSLGRLSARELAEPTRYERALRDRAGVRSRIGQKGGEVGGASTDRGGPKLSTFGSFEVVSPRKSQE